MNLKEAQKKLAKYSQEHVLKYYDKLSATEQESLLTQIAETDFSVVNKIKHSSDDNTRNGKITPIRAMQIPEIEEHREEFTPSSRVKWPPFSWREEWELAWDLTIPRECMISA